MVLVLFVAACRTPAEPLPPMSSVIAEARRLDLAGDQPGAITIFRQALERDEASYQAHYGLARALDLEGHYDEARQHLSRAIELSSDADRDQTLRMMGIAWTFAGRTDEAAGAFKDVFDRRVEAGNMPGAADEANELGRVYLESGDLERAEEWYRTGYETAGRDATRSAALIDLADLRWAHAQARIAARRGQAAEAHAHEAEVKRLVDHGGNDDQGVQYPYLLGYVAFYLEDYKAALEHLARADDADPFILLLMAQASEKLGDADNAFAYYRKVLTSNSHAINAAFARPVARAKLALERKP